MLSCPNSASPHPNSPRPNSALPRPPRAPSRTPNISPHSESISPRTPWSTSYLRNSASSYPQRTVSHTVGSHSQQNQTQPAKRGKFIISLFENKSHI